MGSIKSLVSTIRNASTAVGPPLAVLLADPAERFQQVLLPFAAVALAGAVGALFFRPPDRRAHSSDETSVSTRAA